MEEIEELQKEESLDSSKLSIQSEIEGQKRCLEILNGNSNVHKDFEEGGAFKSIKILGEQDKPEFVQFTKPNNADVESDNNLSGDIQDVNDNVFGYQECFYHAVLRTIENDKGIKFIGKNIQRFAGTDLCDIVNLLDIDNIYYCLYLIATLTYQSAILWLWKQQQKSIIIVLNKMPLEQKDRTKIMQDIKNATVNVKDRKKICQKWLQAVCKHLDTIIKSFDPNKQKIINKFLCQLFFLIFFTNKVDIKPENILVEKNNNNVKFIHTDVDNISGCTGMFDTFENHEENYWYFNKLFLKTIWKRISSNELSKYFNEYIEKYTLTEDKIKKIISRTVRNVFRSNNDIETNTTNEIQSRQLKDICRRSFTRMQKYMRYMLNTVIKEIKLDDGNNKKKTTLIDALKQNCQVLNNVLAGHTIDECVDSSIKKYQTLKQEILHPDEKYNNNDKIQKEFETEIQSANKDNIINTTNNMQANKIYDYVDSSIKKYQTLKQEIPHQNEKYNNNDNTQKEFKTERQSTNKGDIINTANNMQAKYNCWCIGNNDYAGCKTDGSGCGCFGCDIC